MMKVDYILTIPIFIPNNTLAENVDTNFLNPLLENVGVDGGRIKMSKSKRKIKPKKTFYFFFNKIPCVICGNIIKLVCDFALENYHVDDAAEAEKQYKAYYKKHHRPYIFDDYILRAGTATALQAGYLCSSCMRKPLEKRVVNK